MKHLRASLFLIVLALIAGCELLPDEEDEGIDQIDLSEGRRLVYQHDLVFTDSLDEVIEAVHGRYAVGVAATEEAVAGYEGLVRLDAARVDSAVVSSTWYWQGGRRLMDLASRNAGATPTVIPKRSSSDRAPWQMPRIVERLLDAETAFEDSIIVRDDPRVVYRYPLTVGQEWVSFTDPFYAEREVVAMETVEVEAGTFRCVKIRTRIGLDEDLVWYDYVAAEGLVLRTLTSGRERRDASHTPIGTFMADERLELVERE